MAAPVFTEFNLAVKDEEQLYDTMRLAVSLGYERVAVNTFLADLRGHRSKKHKEKEKLVIPSPSEILLKEQSLQSLQVNGKTVKQISRITTLLEDAANTHRLGTAEIQAYDIIAVQPTDEKTFQIACTTLEVDIITLNFSEHMKFPFKRALVKLAIERGIHFEIIYSPALQDCSVKRNIISNALQFANVGKGKNVIISSGADQAIHLRSPYDVINLAKLFGLSMVQAKNSITRNCRAVLLHAASRKSVKSVVSVKSFSLLANKDKWLLKMTDTSADDTDSEEDSDESARNEESEVDEPQLKKIKL